MNTGDKVICVDDDWSRCWADPRKHFDVLPVKGKLYVIKGWATATNGERGIQLIGCESHFKDGMFYPERFRLLEQMKAQSIDRARKAL